MVYFFLRLAFLFMFKVLYRVRVKGAENVPREGMLILASNHASFLDSMVIFHTSPRRFHAVAAKWLFDIWWIAWALRATSCVPTNGSSKGAISVLNNNEAIFIFPEGRCEPDGKILPYVHKGVAVFALKTGAPVVPIYVKGTFNAWPIGQFFPKFFRALEVCYGRPVYFEKVEPDVIPQDALESVTAKIMSEVKALSQ